MNHDQHPHGARLLMTDARVARLLLHEARDRTMARLFGATPDQSFLVSAIAIGSVAAALHEKAGSVVSLRPNAYADTLIGAAVWNVAIHGLVGPRGKDMRFPATLIALAAFARVGAPALEGSVRRARAQAHRFGAALSQRYGG